jgi:hypothetical protein
MLLFISFIILSLLYFISAFKFYKIPKNKLKINNFNKSKNYALFLCINLLLLLFPSTSTYSFICYIISFVIWCFIYYSWFKKQKLFIYNNITKKINKCNLPKYQSPPLPPKNKTIK